MGYENNCEDSSIDNNRDGCNAKSTDEIINNSQINISYFNFRRTTRIGSNNNFYYYNSQYPNVNVRIIYANRLYNHTLIIDGIIDASFIKLFITGSSINFYTNKNNTNHRLYIDTRYISRSSNLISRLRLETDGRLL